MQDGKRLWWIIATALVAGLLWGHWQPLTAQADYEIDKYQVQVNVQQDGSADVTQATTYDFDDDYHGVFNVQDLKGIQGADFQTVTSQLNGGTQTAATASTDGQNNTYQLSQNADRMRVKLYRNVRSGDTLRVVYKYRLRGVVTNYADTAELNWRVIGSGWDVQLSNVKITLQLPKAPIKQLQAWSHGPLDGHTTVDKQAGKIVMTVPKNPANHFVESHLLFPTSVTPTNTRTKSTKRLKAAQQHEAGLAQAANKKRRQQALIDQLIFGGALGIWLIVIIANLWWFKRHPTNQHQRPVPLNHSFDVPTVSPAVAESLFAGKSPDTNALTGEILIAAANAEIAIETLDPNKRKPDVQLTRLKPIQNSFLEWCFQKGLKKDVITLAELKKFGQRDKSGRLNKQFIKWQHGVDQDVAVYQDEQNYAVVSHWLGTAVAVTLLGLVVFGASLLVGAAWPIYAVTLLVTIVFWVLWGLRKNQILINTDEGLSQRNQITGFRRMLKDIGHFNTAEIGDLILWERILPYAAAFGLAKKVTAKLAVDFDTAALTAGLGVYYPLFFISGNDFDFSGVINDSFSGALSSSSNSSSPSGGSGGFSGGSSGGFGGGSGGGAF